MKAHVSVWWLESADFLTLIESQKIEALARASQQLTIHAKRAFCLSVLVSDIEYYLAKKIETATHAKPQTRACSEGHAPVPSARGCLNFFFGQGRSSNAFYSSVSTAFQESPSSCQSQCVEFELSSRIARGHPLLLSMNSLTSLLPPKKFEYRYKFIYFTHRCTHSLSSTPLVNQLIPKTIGNRKRDCA